MDIDQLAIRPVDSASPIPLYHQIELDLRRLIASGIFKPGDVLPPEIALGRVYGVGRHTMRMALARLAADNLIARQAGRGTFVTQQPNPAQFYLDRSFTRQMADLGLTAHSQVLSQNTGTIDASMPLRSRVGAPYLRLCRLRFGGDTPVSLQDALILLEHSPGLETYDFNRASLYDVLSRHYNLTITEIRHTISAAVADPYQAELLQVAPGDPLLVVRTQAYIHRAELIEYTTSHYRADQYEYRTTHVYAV